MLKSQNLVPVIKSHLKVTIALQLEVPYNPPSVYMALLVVMHLLTALCANNLHVHIYMT